MVTIRPATEADADAILKLTIGFATSFEIKETAWRRSFATILRDPSALLLVAESEGAIAGYLLAFEHPTLHANGPTAWVDEVAVKQSHQRAGIGTLLMTATENWARDRGCVLVSLATRRADDFYAAIGYEESATYFRKVFS